MNDTVSAQEASLVINLAAEAEFPPKPDGDTPRIESIRHQVALFVAGYRLAKSQLPARIVVNTGDLKHCMRRVAARMQKPHREKAKAAWQERRSKGSKQRWSDVRPPTLVVDGMTWNGIPIESIGYTRHRSVDKS